jgi:transposase-like protein
VSASAPPELPSYRGYRYAAEIISHAVWLYFRFSLSLRDVEELMAERGVTVTYETIRARCAKFGPSYAARDYAVDEPRRVTSGTWMRCR